MRGRKPAVIVTGDLENLPTPPAWLSKEAKAEWRRVVPILIERRILTDADLAVMAGYCSAVGEIAQASKIIAVEGLTFEGKTGPKRHPAVGVRNEALAHMRQYAAELGLTPVSRSRPSVRDDDPANPDLGLE
ncbi:MULTISPECIES: phage terminase small subunit P27 family [unclassified Beijerinckia]|uniref:phage terminase small subunit P27 family n=1 Tax=unclassified Beijerinckia TaxID=2638183 RepID=UPI00089C4FDE|nr:MULTISPECIES: phage terminase small subunit P27 family [unclassified Beijerinckia]MDH7795801.1 P27 family predicted phage terminase small subunit [Beijerinckia sp. GAS462]SEC16977.1 phage terminase, small subunit, putative, P27 family [Beijerinckia sp. 28-YEA-48]